MADAVTTRIGVDLGRHGRDPTNIAVLAPGEARVRAERQHGDLFEIADRVCHIAAGRGDVEVTLDDTGAGGGLADVLRERGLRVRTTRVSLAAALVFVPGEHL